MATNEEPKLEVDRYFLRVTVEVVDGNGNVVERAAAGRIHRFKDVDTVREYAHKENAISAWVALIEVVEKLIVFYKG